MAYWRKNGALIREDLALSSEHNGILSLCQGTLVFVLFCLWPVPQRNCNNRCALSLLRREERVWSQAFLLSESLVGDANSLLSSGLAFGIMIGAGKEDSELFVSFLKLLTLISKISVYKDPVSLFPSKQPWRKPVSDFILYPEVYNEIKMQY